jgi:dTDP-4-dehydrorhamnose 3,5-epimerase
VKRVYLVHNHAAGTIRGFHLHKIEWKVFVVSQGAAKFVALDPSSPETTFTFVSSARRPSVIVIPPGYANGWISLEAGTTLVAASTSTFEESLRDDVRLDPHGFGDLWSVRAR